MFPKACLNSWEIKEHYCKSWTPIEKYQQESSRDTTAPQSGFWHQGKSTNYEERYCSYSCSLAIYFSRACSSTLPHSLILKLSSAKQSYQDSLSYNDQITILGWALGNVWVHHRLHCRQAWLCRDFNRSWSREIIKGVKLDFCASRLQESTWYYSSLSVWNWKGRKGQ